MGSKKFKKYVHLSNDCFELILSFLNYKFLITNIITINKRFYNITFNFLFLSPFISKKNKQNYFKEAILQNHTNTIKILLKDKRVNPADDDNYAIKRASYNGHLEIVKLLLKDKRVNPADDNNYAIIWASENGHLEIVKLLKDKRVNSLILNF